MVSLSFPFGVTLFLAVIGFFAGRAKATSSVNGNFRLLQALPKAYGQTVLFSTLIPASLLLFGWAFVVRILGPDFAVLPDFVFQGLVIAIATIGAGVSYHLIKPSQRARAISERWIMGLLIAASALAIVTTIGIVLSMLSESANFFRQHSWTDFFLGPSGRQILGVAVSSAFYRCFGGRYISV